MLPETVLSFLSEAAEQARVSLPDPDSSLFESGVLDSFNLVDFVGVLEKECGIKIDDSQLRPENFDTVARVERFVHDAKARH
jgi:acyl carrier protein